jgi:hypothetical protein
MNYVIKNANGWYWAPDLSGIAPSRFGGVWEARRLAKRLDREAALAEIQKLYGLGVSCLMWHVRLV